MSWSESGPLWLVSPRLESWQKKILIEIRERAPRCKEMVWLLSSGSQSVRSVKCIGLTREAIEVSAESVNRHLAVSARDRWLLALPDFHIGGFAIHIRAKLSRSKVSVLKSWSPEKFLAEVNRSGATLSSLVPTQVFDLVNTGLRAPKSLRAIVVGGGALTPWLYNQARELGWPLLPSFGMTEAASQIATASLDSLKSQIGRTIPPLKILSHVRIKTQESHLFLAGGSMARWVAQGREDGQYSLELACPQGWLKTQDLVEIQDHTLQPIGRADQVIKVLGTLVAIPEIESELAEIKDEFCVISTRDARKGHRLILVTASYGSLKAIEALVESYNEKTSGPRRIEQICWVPELPKGELNKIKRAQLKSDLGF